MIFFWYGENQYGIKQQLASLKAKYVEKTGSNVEVQTLNMAEHDVSDLLNALGVIPMFVTSRLIVVRDLGSKKPDQKVCDEIVEHTPKSTNLVLIEPSPDKRSTYFKVFSKQGGAKEFKNVSRSQLAAWLQNQAKKHGAEFGSANAMYLIDVAGQDQWKLAGEVQKLASHSPQITRQTIDELVSPSVEYSAFALTDALMRRDLARTLKLYQSLQTQGEADQKILGAVMYQYRVLLALVAGGDAPKSMGISPYALQKSRGLAAKMGTSDLKRYYAELANADLAIKTGELSSQEAMKRLFERLCS